MNRFGYRPSIRSLWYHLTWKWDAELAYRWILVIAVGLALGGIIANYNRLPELVFLALIGGIVGSIWIASIGHLRRWLIAGIIIELPLQFDINLGWNNTYGLLGTQAGFNVSLATFFIASLYLLWVLELIITRKKVPHSPSLRAGWPIIFYLSAVALSGLFAPNPSFSFYELMMLIQIFLLFIYLAGTLRTQNDLLFIVCIMFIALNYENIIAILQRFGMARQLAGDQTANSVAFRVSGTFASPNTAGAYIGMWITPMIALLFMPVHRFIRAGALFTLALSFVAIIFMQSRGSWVALAISMFVFFGAIWFRGFVSTRQMIAVLMAIASMGILFSETIVERFTGDDQGSAEGRAPLNQLALNIAEDYPILGVGSNNFAYVMDDYIGPEISGAWISTVHNKYLLLLSEVGIFGLGTFLLYLFVIVYRGWYSWRQRDIFYSIFALAMTTSIMGHMFHLSVDKFNWRSSVQMLWFNAAIITAIYYIFKEMRQQSHGGQPNN